MASPNQSHIEKSRFTTVSKEKMSLGRRVSAICHNARYYSVKARPTVQTLDRIEDFPAGSTILSMIQPTGQFHLGNYLGAIRSWKQLSETDSANTKYLFAIADLHAITTPQDPRELKRRRYEAIASLLASGLDHDKCTLYHQSSVPEHTELNWYLTSIASMGNLNRMTQWKLKSQLQQNSSIYDDNVLDNTRAGLLCYPVLQAADILIYKATHVPVGDDQSQHLELCRGLANSFNHQFKTKFFPIPKTLLTPAKKILSLRNPSKKMSKSDPDQNSSLFMTETPENIMKKVRKATTDSIQGKVYFDPINRPGVSNMINIISGLTNKSIDETVSDLEWIQDHKQLKDHLIELLIEEFKEKRRVYNELIGDFAYLDTICKSGTGKARQIALANIVEIRKIMGLD